AYEKGLHRLEPERRIQNDRQRLFTARQDLSPVRVCSGRVGRAFRRVAKQGRGCALLYTRRNTRARRKAGRPVQASIETGANTSRRSPAIFRAATHASLEAYRGSPTIRGETRLPQNSR